MTIHEQIVHAFNAYLSETQSFDERGIKAAAAKSVDGNAAIAYYRSQAFN